MKSVNCQKHFIYQLIIYCNWNICIAFDKY